MDKRYVVLINLRGINICTLKAAVPSEGDRLGYVIDHPHFKERHYSHVHCAIDAINAFKGDGRRK